MREIFKPDFHGLTPENRNRFPVCSRENAFIMQDEGIDCEVGIWSFEDDPDGDLVCLIVENSHNPDLASRVNHPAQTTTSCVWTTRST